MDESLADAPFGDTSARGIDPGPAATEDWLEPSDTLMVWVAYALRELSEAAAEPASIRSTAWLLLASVCAADMSFGELLRQPDLAAWALTAMEGYEPPEGDLVGESACWHIELELREALKAAAAAVSPVEETPVS